MESIKNLLEDWQKTLNMVINSKLTILNIDPHPIDVASLEAMGDYSKPHESSDSDSDFRNSCTDMRSDEYGLSWAQNPYKPYAYNYEVSISLSYSLQVVLNKLIVANQYDMNYVKKRTALDYAAFV